MLSSLAKRLALSSIIALVGCREPYQRSEQKGGFVITEHMFYNPMRIEGSSLEYRFTEICNEHLRECYLSHYDKELQAGLIESPNKQFVILIYNNRNGIPFASRGLKYKFMTRGGRELKCAGCDDRLEYLSPTIGRPTVWADTNKVLLQNAYPSSRISVYRVYVVEFLDDRYRIGNYLEIPYFDNIVLSSSAKYDPRTRRLAFLVCNPECELSVKGEDTGGSVDISTPCLLKDDPSLEISGDDFVVKCSKVDK